MHIYNDKYTSVCIWKELKLIIEKRNIKIKDIAQYTWKTSGYISQLLSGEKRISENMLESIANSVWMDQDELSEFKEQILLKVMESNHDNHNPSSITQVIYVGLWIYLLSYFWVFQNSIIDHILWVLWISIYMIFFNKLSYKQVREIFSKWWYINFQIFALVLSIYFTFLFSLDGRFSFILEPITISETSFIIFFTFTIVKHICFFLIILDLYSKMYKVVR